MGSTFISPFLFHCSHLASKLSLNPVLPSPGVLGQPLSVTHCSCPHPSDPTVSAPPEVSRRHWGRWVSYSTACSMLPQLRGRGNGLWASALRWALLQPGVASFKTVNNLTECVLLYVVVVFIAQLCLTLGDPMDCSPPDSPCPWNYPGKNTGVSQYRILV